MTDAEAKKAKEEATARLVAALPLYRERLEEIDQRVWKFASDAANPDRHNLYEQLGVLKFLRMLDTYPLDLDTVHLYITKIEGRWDGARYLDGGLEFDGKHVRLMPYQVWAIAGIYLFQHEVRMREFDPNVPLLPSEFIKEIEE